MKKLSFVVAFAVAIAVGGTTFGQGSDDCATAEAILGLTPGGTVTVAVDNTLATDSPEAFTAAACGGPAGADGFGDMAADVWFSFTAPGDGVMDFSTCVPIPALLDTDLVVYQGDSGTCGALFEEDCDGDGCDGFGSFAGSTPVVGGTSYLVRVGGWDAASIGTTDLVVTHWGSNPAFNVICTDNNDGNNPEADVTYELPAPPGGAATYDEVRVYVDGVLADTTPTPAAGAGTFTGLVMTGGAGVVNEICIETVTGGLVSPQVCCNAFIPLPCPAAAGGPVGPVATLAPFVGNVNCGNAAGSAENRYFRSFDLVNGYGISDDITLTCFSMLVDAAITATGTVPIRIRLNYDTDGGAPNNLASHTLFYEEEFQVPDMADEIYNFVFGTGVVDPDALGLSPTPNVGCLDLISPGTTLVVEIRNADSAGGGDFFFTGSSDPAAGPELSPTYIMAPACNLNSPLTFAQIGFPNTFIPMDISYNIAAAGVCGGGGGVANLNCSQTVAATTAELTWDNAAGGVQSFTVEVDGGGQTSVGLATSFTTAPLTAYTTANIVVRGFTGTGGTGTEINSRACTISIAPENNWLAGAQGIVNGTTPMNIETPFVTVTGPALDPLLECDMDGGGQVGGDEQLWNDLYYTYTPSVTGDVLVSTCSGTTGDSRIAVYTGLSNLGTDVIACNDDRIIGGGPPGQFAPNFYNPACTNFASELSFAGTQGVTVTIRVGTFNAAGFVPGGELTVNDCIPVTDLAASMDCTNGDVTLTWTDNPAATSISVIRDGVVIAASLPLGTTSYDDLGVSDGDHVYEVSIDCGSGANVASIPVSVLTYTNYTDLVFSMEGLQSSPLGDRGDIDSGAELLTSLLNAGRNAAMVRQSFLDYPCVDSADNVYVMLGTNQGSVIIGAGVLTPAVLTVGPAYILSSAENDALGTLGNNGKNVYLEGGDHWAFDHQPGLFDLRDGIDDATLAGPGFIAGFDGDDTLTGVDGADGGFGLDLSGLQDMVYTQDSAINDDFTDQLTVATLDGFGPSAGVIARIDDLLVVPPALSYDTMIHYDTDSGGKTVSSSFEFGGIAQSTERDAIALAIVNAFGSGPPVGETFVRGDINIDANVNIADAIFLLGVLFPPAGGTPTVNTCDDSADVNDDGNKNIADAIFLLGVLFPPAGGSPNLIPPPNTCGLDPTTTDTLDCATYVTGSCP